MSIEFLVEVDKKIFEISELVTKVSYKDVLNDGCSKLEFSYINDDLIIENGSNVWFTYDKVKIFCGFVFKVNRNKEKEISVTAYDQLRYCKAKDFIVVKNDTTTTLVNKMCNYFKMRNGTISDTKYKLATSSQDGKTWLDIIYSSISDTLMNTGKKYLLRDDFGTISLRDIEDLKLNLILGDESLCYDFDYKKSIDDDFYNQIKIHIKSDIIKESQFVGPKDEKSILRYGLLQYYESVDKDTNVAQAKAKADILLSLYNREQETLTLECLGDTSIRAGSSFYAYLMDVKLNKRLIVKEVTHDFLPNHTMSLEVMT